MRHPPVAFLSHPPVTVPAMGALFSGVVVQLPLLAVLVTGFVLVSGRRAAIGGRSALLARVGLAVLTVSVLLQVLWTALFPWLLAALDLNYSRFGVLSFAVGLVLSLVHAAAIALLVAAIVTRARQEPQPQPQPQPGFPEAGTAGPWGPPR